uniref:ADP-ribosyl cyclase/cyclic ADP-ribose hydrolase n=1 Tax=Fagus sylvatica TaxID=28930 RepID=A0A2N9FIP3_FAGSY
MDVTASSSSPTSSSSTSSSTARWKYDVFLSFRGEDTRYSFTDLIYAALIKEDINTFKDDENLEKGKRISELFKEIEQSRFAIVIFSKDYASSTWCLDELAKIVQCEKEKGMTVLPVFYDVQPSDVRSENGTFAHALIEHEKKNTEKVQQWRDALTHVSYISGWTVMNRPQSQVIQSIVEKMISGNLSYTVSKDTEGLVEKAIEKQWSLTYKEISSDLNKLKPHMSAIQALLQDAEKKQVKNEGLIDWLGQVKDVFYDAEDVRDEFECEALRRQVLEAHGSIDSTSYSFDLHDFKGMTHSFVHDSYVIGRDEDKEKTQAEIHFGLLLVYCLNFFYDAQFSSLLVADIPATSVRDFLLPAIQNLLKDSDALDPAHKEALEIIMKERSGGTFETISKVMGAHLGLASSVSSFFGEGGLLGKKKMQSHHKAVESPKPCHPAEETRFKRIMRGNFTDMLRGKAKSQSRKLRTNEV